MPPPDRTDMHEPEFARLQRAFTRHLRDPQQAAPPGQHEERRLAIYRNAVYANIEHFMSDNYPRVRAVTDATRWQDMVRDYLIRHAARASAFVDLPLEFLAYLEHERRDPADPPFLCELAHFDWLETLIGTDERRIEMSGIDAGGDLLEGIPVANPILTMVTYRFPVHAITPEYQPHQPPPRPTRIAAFRDPDNLYGFLDLNGPAARLLGLIVAGTGSSGRQIFALIADELGQDHSALVAAGSTILARMKTRGVILGTARR